LGEQVSATAFDNPLANFKALYLSTLELKLHEGHSLYLPLPNEEWSVKILGNLLMNHLNKDEKLKELILKGQNLWVLHNTAGKSGQESAEAQ
jgi:hypothetical protein